MQAANDSLQSKPLNLTFAIPIGKTERFWEDLKEGRVSGTRCKKCGTLHFPPAADCSECMSNDVEWTALNGEAELLTYTHVIVRPASFMQQETYTVGVAKLKEGVNVLAWVTGIKRSDIKIGMKLKLISAKTLDGKPTYNFVSP
jgi:uncharacterized OB-fold protein